MSSERVLVTGAAGRLGRRVCADLGERAAGFTSQQLDIADAAAVEATVKEVSPSAIVNCAAYTDVDRAQAETGRAHAVNAEGPGNLARAATDAGAFLVHISTDYVFDGRAGHPYAETDTTNPIQVYGATKLAGERAALDAAPSAAVLRTSWLYGPGDSGFVESIMKAAREGVRPLRVVADQIGSPTFAGDLSSAIMTLLDRPASGIFHTAATGWCSRHDIARVILAGRGIDPNIVEPCSTQDLPPRAAERPANTSLICPAWEAAGLDPLPEWMPALLAALEQWQP